MIIRATCVSMLVACTTLSTATAIHAAASPEQTCQKARYAAAAKYAGCEIKVVAKNSGYQPFGGKMQEALGKCRVKYAATWAKLQAKAAGSGSICDNPRFDTTTAPGTAIDRLTGLQWTQTTDDASVRDKDNAYTWSAGGGGFTAADGTMFTTFLATLNGGACFGGHCDWRLPTRTELQTLLAGGSPCTTPCIDEAVFGPVNAPFAHWSATTLVWVDANAWYANSFGEMGATGKFDDALARAVRGGL